MHAASRIQSGTRARLGVPRMQAGMRGIIPLAVVAAAALAACDRELPSGPVAPSADAAGAIEPPDAPVIWLHYDYMVLDDPDGHSPAHSDAPHQETIDTLVAAFRRRGIQVVIDPRHTIIPHHRLTDVGACDAVPDHDCIGYYELRTRYFHPADAARPWHYAVFVHNAWWGEPVSGFAELDGQNFLVALGGFFHEPPHLFWQCGQDFLSYGVCVRIEAGTTMHELGHNLDLNHGGADGLNYKPNYVSIMNYKFQLGGIPFAAIPGQTAIAGWRIDYSDLALPALDEDHLDERAGLGGPANDADISFYSTYACSDPGGADDCGIFGSTSVAATGPADWNGNGIIEPDVRYDVSFLEQVTLGSSTPRFNVLSGFDDWAHVQQWLRTPAYLAGTLHSRGVVP
jgi:hypothetical protein